MDTVFKNLKGIVGGNDSNTYVDRKRVGMMGLGALFAMLPRGLFSKGQI